MATRTKILLTIFDVTPDMTYFDLYSNVDDFVTPFEQAVSVDDLKKGYITYGPNGLGVVRIKNTNPSCGNYVDVPMKMDF